MSLSTLVAIFIFPLVSCGSMFSTSDQMNQRGKNSGTGEFQSSNSESDSQKASYKSEKEKEKESQLGIALYDQNCASCHQGLVESTKLDRDVNQIKNAIRDISVMKALSALTDKEIALIAEVLKVPKEVEPPKDGEGDPILLDGVQLYALNCAGCHGQIQDSTKKGKSLDQLKSAIQSVAEMSGTKLLIEEQLEAIILALKVDGGGSGDPPMDDTARGAMLYANSCQGCHGVLDSSSKKGRGISAITNAITNVNDMKSLSYLSSEEIGLIAKVLASSSNTVVEARGRIGNRFTLKSKFLSIFNTSNAAASNYLNNSITTSIYNKISAFGGPCSRYDATCPGGENASTVNMSAAVDPLANPMRRGYIENFCRRVVFNNTLVDSFVANIGLSSSTGPSRADISNVIHAFKPGYDIPNSVTNKLDALRLSTKSKNYSSLDQWRFLILPVCSSIAVEVL